VRTPQGTPTRWTHPEVGGGGGKLEETRRYEIGRIGFRYENWNERKDTVKKEKKKKKQKTTNPKPPIHNQKSATTRPQPNPLQEGAFIKREKGTDGTQENLFQMISGTSSLENRPRRE